VGLRTSQNAVGKHKVLWPRLVEWNCMDDWLGEFSDCAKLWKAEHLVVYVRE
jgi:hypothetical protein